MDPNAAAAVMRDPAADLDDRLEAAHSLRDWIAKGGYPQSMGRSFGGNTAARFAAQQEIDEFLRLHGEVVVR